MNNEGRNEGRKERREEIEITTCPQEKSLIRDSGKSGNKNELT